MYNLEAIDYNNKYDYIYLQKDKMISYINKNINNGLEKTYLPEIAVKILDLYDDIAQEFARPLKACLTSLGYTVEGSCIIHKNI